MLFCVIKLPYITFDWLISGFRFSIPSKRLIHLTCDNWTCSLKLVKDISGSVELIKKYLSFKIWMIFSIHVMASATKPSLCFNYAVSPCDDWRKPANCCKLYNWIHYLNLLLSKFTSHFFFTDRPGPCIEIFNIIWSHDAESIFRVLKMSKRKRGRHTGSKLHISRQRKGKTGILYF